MRCALLVRNGRVVDGSGGAAFPGDVAVDGGRIVAVGRLEGASGAREVDAAGQVVCPGFVDVHAHSDLPLLWEPRNEPKVRQGITTELLGADGLSFAPLGPQRLAEARRYLSSLYGDPAGVASEWGSVAEYLARLDGRIATNALYVVPHQALRLEVRGWRGGAASAEETEAMQRLLRQGLAEGARGLGTGLDYFPHNNATTDELVALCRVVAQADGVYVVHVRYQQVGVVAAVREVVEVAERSGVKVLISHLRSPEALPLIDEARARGLDILFDTYPYSAGSSMFLSFLPDWVHEGGPGAYLARIAEPGVRTRLRGELDARLTAPERVVVSNVGEGGPEGYVGRTLAEIMADRGTDQVDTICDLLLETELAAGWILHSGTEEDLRRCMQHPAHMASTDGILVGQRPHPRAWGTYPRYLGRYVRELGWLSLEACVRKMSGLPAERFGLADRGRVQERYAADLVVFDPERVSDQATYEEPRQYPLGISYVVVNGELVVDGGEHTGALPGRVLAAVVP